MSGVSKLTMAASAAILTALMFAGCSSEMTPQPSPETKALTGDQSVTVLPGDVHETFDTPDAAVKALLDAVQSDNHDDLKKIFGPASRDLVSGDPVADKNAYQTFAQRTQEKAELEERTPTVDVLHIGAEDWPFPIPIVKNAEGKWYFDTKAGQEEIISRRIGSNELTAINIAHEYVNAQREYASRDHDNSGVLKYAQRLKSKPGLQDGLYWDATDATGQSPFGPLADTAQSEGYEPISGAKYTSPPYHGYHFRILTAQGPAAAGGPYNYIINGNMIAGFALVAWPDEYQKSGVMTFIVSHQGKVFQKDLGTDTATKAKSMTEFNPDASWSEVK